MNKYQDTFETWNKIAKLYQDTFMDLDIYNDSSAAQSRGLCAALVKKIKKNNLTTT